MNPDLRQQQALLGDTSDNLGGAAAILTRIDVDVEHVFAVLRPGYGGGLLCRRAGFTFCIWFTTGFGCDLFTQGAIGFEHPVTISFGIKWGALAGPPERASIKDDTSKTGQADPGFRGQSNEPCHEIQGLSYNV